ncbi:MAG: acyltransferase family protein [Flavobacterium sp.]|nr:acyltransferase family protein [Flavobacterium sp.]
MKERLLYIDRLRGFAIFLVVEGHIISYNVFNSNHNVLFQIIYSFHMPFFFFLSGYVANLTTKIDSVKSYFIYNKNKAISLLIPMISWPLIHCYFFTATKDFSFNMLSNIIYSEVLNPGLWFLKMLFEVIVVYSVFFVFSSLINNKTKIFIDIAILFSIVLFFVGFSFFQNNNGIMTFLLNFCFFMVGVFLSRYQILKKIVKNINLATMAAVLFMLIIGHYNFSEADTAIMKGLKVIISLLAIVLFYNLSQRVILDKKIDNYLCKSGRNSLVIYVTHFTFFYILNNTMLLDSDISFFLLILITVPLSVLLISFCLGLGNIIALFPILNLIFYGVRFKKK